MVAELFADPALSRTPEMRALSGGRRELTDGYALKLDEHKISAAEINGWITLEGKCCPFLRFALVPGGGAIWWLHLTGGAGVEDFLKAEIGA